MSDINEIKDGFNAGYILKTKSPEVYALLQGSLNEVDIPFFSGFVAGGKEKSVYLENDKSEGLEL